jgi:hypothetical protein
MDHFPSSPDYTIRAVSKFQKFAEIFAAQGAPPVSTINTSGKWKKSSIRKVFIISFGDL